MSIRRKDSIGLLLLTFIAFLAVRIWIELAKLRLLLRERPRLLVAGRLGHAHRRLQSSVGATNTLLNR